MHEASVHAWTPSCDVTLTVCWEQSSEFSKTALEFRAFFFVQRLLPERVQQRFCGSNKHEHIRSNGHDELNDRGDRDQRTNSGIGGAPCRIRHTIRSLHRRNTGEAPCTASEPPGNRHSEPDLSQGSLPGSIFTK